MSSNSKEAEVEDHKSFYLSEPLSSNNFHFVWSLGVRLYEVYSDVQFIRLLNS